MCMRACDPACLRRRRNRRRSHWPPACVELQPDHVRPGEYLEARPILQFETNSQEFQIVCSPPRPGVAAAGRRLRQSRDTRTGPRRDARTRDSHPHGPGRRAACVSCASCLPNRSCSRRSAAFAALLLSTVRPEGGFNWSHNPASTPSPGLARARRHIRRLRSWRRWSLGCRPPSGSPAWCPAPAAPAASSLAAQVAVSCLLLVVSGLLVGGLKQLGRDRAGLRLSPSRLGLAGSESPRLWRRCREGVSRSPSRAHRRLAGRPGGIAGLAWRRGATSTWEPRWMGRQFAGNHVDPQFLETMGMHLVRGRNFRPGEEGVVDDQRSNGARFCGRIRTPSANLSPGMLRAVPRPPSSASLRNASTTVVGNPEPLEFYLPPSRSDAPTQSCCCASQAHPHDFVRRLQDAARALDGRLQPAVQVVSDAYDRRSEEHFPRTRGDRDPGYRGHPALGHWPGRPRRLHRGTTHARDRPADRARRSRRAGSARHPGPDEPCHRHRFRLRRPWRVGSGQSPAEWNTREWPGSMCSTRLAYLVAMAFFAAVVALSILAPGRRAIRINPSKALQHE